MTEVPPRLAPNTDQVFASVIDGEAIIMNVQSGVYYSTDGVGALIWTQLEAGASVDEIIAAVVAAYAVPPEQARADVERLARELLGHGIVVDPGEAARPPASTPGPSEVAAAMGADTSSRRPYAPPTLAVYHDMGDLLALDPPAPETRDLRWSR